MSLTSFNRPAPEATAREERRPIMQQNGGRPLAPIGSGMEMATNYNSTADTTQPLEGQEAALPSMPQPKRHNDTADQEGVEGWLSCLKVSILLWSCCLLGVVTALLGIIILASAVSLLEHLPPNTCTSSQCYKAAGNILSSLQEDVSPCDDFAEFACGGWQKEHPLPESKFRWGIFDDLDEKTLLDVQGLLEEDLQEDEPHVIKVTKTVYQACVNESQWEEAGAMPLLTLLKKEGGLPMIEPDWDEEFNVMKTLSRMRRTLANQHLISVIIQPDSRNTSNNVIYMNQGMLTLRREYYTPDTPLSRYHKAAHISLMKQAGEFLLKAQKQERNQTFLNNLYRDVEDLWEFSVKVAEITEQVEFLDPWQLYNPTTVKELQALTDVTNSTFKVDWLSFLKDVFNGTGIHLTETQQLVVDRPAYLPRLVNLLEHAPARTLANYLLFPVVPAMGEEINDQLPNPPLHAATGSLGRRSSRIWYDCAKKVRLMIPFGVGALYVRHHLSSITQNLTLQMVEDVSAAFRDMLVEASWIDPATLKEALHKLDEMQHLVAFPPHALIDHLLEEYHQGIPEVKKNDHFGNMLALTAWQCHKSLLKLTSPESQDSWPRGPLDINAFYSALRNAIVIPQGVLQPPIFIPEKLTALNYGSLGSIIGHETTHGFDSTGRMRDAHGNLNHWWTNTTRQQYINRTQCFVKQYSTYDVAPLLPPHQQLDHELMISGERTLAENIADNGGLRAAWVAYQRRVKKDGRGHTLSLPGLQHFTSDQLFFISFAKVWCNNITPFALQYILKADVHVPGYFRILGVLRNSPAFAEAFKCPIGSPMNPKEKCLLW